MDSGKQKPPGRSPRSWLDRIFARRQFVDGFVLALGGGGGRGLAHLGVLKALEEQGLRPAAIVGTSIGALLGAMYALELDAEGVRSRVEAFGRSSQFSDLKLPAFCRPDNGQRGWLERLSAAAQQSLLIARAWSNIAVEDAERVINVARTLCGEKSFDDLQIPFYATAVHYPSGESRLFSEGDLVRAVAASMALPGIFEPVAIDGERFVDGGVASEIPAREARTVAGAGRVVLAVNVGARPHPAVEPRNVIGMLDWAMQVKAYYLREFKVRYADVLVEPLVGDRVWNDFSTVDGDAERGYRAMQERLPALLDLLEHGRGRSA